MVIKSQDTAEFSGPLGHLWIAYLLSLHSYGYEVPGRWPWCWSSWSLGFGGEDGHVAVQQNMLEDEFVIDGGLLKLSILGCHSLITSSNQQKQK